MVDNNTKWTPLPSETDPAHGASVKRGFALAEIVKKNRGGNVRGFDKLVKANGATAGGDTTSTGSGDGGTTDGAIAAIIHSNNTGNEHLISELNKALKLVEGLESFFNAFPIFSKANAFKNLNLGQSIKHDINMTHAISKHLNEAHKRKESNNEASNLNEPPPKKKRDDTLELFIETVD